MVVESKKRKVRSNDAVESQSKKTRLENNRRLCRDPEEESSGEDDEDNNPITRRNQRGYDGDDGDDDGDDDSLEDTPNVDLPKDEMGRYVCPFKLNRPPLTPVCECPSRKTKGAVNPSR